jgi:hypothetical protein
MHLAGEIIPTVLWFALLGSGAWFGIHHFRALTKMVRTDAPTIYGDVIEIPSVSLRLHNDGGL